MKIAYLDFSCGKNRHAPYYLVKLTEVSTPNSEWHKLYGVGKKIDEPLLSQDMGHITLFNMRDSIILC